MTSPFKLLRRTLLLIGAASTLHAADLGKGFVNPPDSARPWTFWFWINGNVSKEGIRADFEDMKRVGIGGAMLFDGSMYLPPGPVRYGSDLWHEHVQYAIQVADELGLQLGVMNCGGWATAGGPWISLEQSMKMLVWSEQSVTGGTRWKGTLPQPPTREKFYHDVVVLAVPDDTMEPKKVPAQNSSLTFDFPQSATPRTLMLPASEDEAVVSGKLAASDDGATYSAVCTFADSSKDWPMPIAVSLPPTSARFFRVSFDKTLSADQLASVKLLDCSRVTNLAAQLGVRPLKSEPGEDKTTAIPLDQVFDLTKLLKPDGSLQWDAPPGHWTILRFGYTTTAETNHPAVPEATGWEVDKFDSQAVAYHFDHGLGRVIREAGPHLGRSLTAVVSDSWEAGPQTWTAKMPQLFENHRGYPIGKFFACFAGRIVDSPAETDAFLRDYRKTIGDLYAEEYYGTMARLAHEHGLSLMAEGYGGVLDEFKVDEALDIPAVEFWAHDLYKSCGIVPSVAHTMDKPIVMSEAFTARPPDHSRWLDTPASLKTLGDVAFTVGVNRFALHSYVHQPRSDIAPGFTHGRYGVQFGRLNSWWPLAGGWIDYIKRCQFLLQQGTPVADLLYLAGEKLQTEERDLNFPWPEGHKGDYLSINQLALTKVEGGKIRVKGPSIYHALVLPETCYVSTDALRQLSRLREEGAKFLGGFTPLPAGVKDLDNPEWLGLAKAWTQPNATVQTLDLPPDFQANQPLRFIHRTDKDFDVYFVANPGKEGIRTDALFRITGREPELWDPTTGEIQPAPAFAMKSTQTLVPLSLDPAGSIFVVFRHPAKEQQRNVPPPPTMENVAINGPWTVTFQENRGAPKLIQLDALASLSKHSDPGVRFFSGLATYTTEIEALKNAHRVALDLGTVRELADVRVNGKEAGILWKPPYIVDITSLLQPGKNQLAVTVADRWVNRLIGDETLPPDAEYLTGGQTEDYGGRNPGALKAFPSWWNDPAALAKRQRITFATWQHFTAKDPLVDSGLIGPVRLLITK